MANTGGKGNPAAKRMSNVKRGERRRRSWARGERRKLEREKANQARMRANADALSELGGQREMYERVVERDGKTIRRMKRESPGSALYRIKRGYGRDE